MNRDELHTALESAATEGGSSKADFLQSLYDKIDVVSLRQSARLLQLLESRKELPVGSSRFDLSDLLRRISCISWDETASAISGVVEIVDECVTVSGGDCDECMGDELVFMWDSSEEKVVQHCKLCGNTIDLSGKSVAESPFLQEATNQQLADVGVTLSD